MNKLTITEFHLGLLKKAYFQLEDAGYGPVVSMDPKRPYGNSDITGDLAEILVETIREGFERTDPGNHTIDLIRDEDRDEMVIIDVDYAIHRGKDLADLLKRSNAELATVIQILASRPAEGIRSGETYVKTQAYGRRGWELLTTGREDLV